MVCSKCGAKPAAPSQFCPNCGETLKPAQEETQNAGNRPETDPKAAVSMVLGVLSILLSVFAGIPAVIFGHLSRASIRRSMGQLKGDGMAMAGQLSS